MMTGKQQSPQDRVGSLLDLASKALAGMLEESACGALRQAQHHVDCAVQVLDDNAKQIAAAMAVANKTDG